MCFNYKLSLLAITLHYSAVGYILSKTKLRNDKNLLYCMLFLTITTGLVEPIEGLIHYKYVDNMQVQIPVMYRKVFKYALLMQPLFSNVIFMLLKVNSQFNKLSWNWVEQMSCLLIFYHVISFWLPLILSSRRQGWLRQLLVNQIIIYTFGLALAKFYGKRNVSL